MKEKENNYLNIAMLGHKYVPSREGGVEVVVEELSTRIVERGHRVTCFNRTRHKVAGREHSKANLNEYKGVRMKEVFTIERRGFAAMTSSLFASLEAAFGSYDVVHIHAEGPAFFSFIPHFMGKKVVVTVHGLDWDRAKWGKFASWYIRNGEKNAVKYADEIIVLSEGVKKYFWNKYERITNFIPNGVNKPEIREANEIKKWGLEKDNYILFLGRIVPEKGLNYLVSAWKGIQTQKKLVIAGGPSDTDDFYSGLKKESEDIIFTGFVQGKVMEELYSNAYVYILPSDIEGMPLSLLEAMSFGNCCLVSDIDECASVVEDKGIVFQKGNINDLRDKLEWIIEHEEEVKKYKAVAREFVCKKYNWNDVVERTLELYK